MHRFFEKIKGISVRDIGHIFIFIAALIPAKMLKKKRPHIWLICELDKEARDTGYWFYKYICENRSECDVVYAIDKNCPDYDRVKNLGQVISYGTFEHWKYYLAAEANISSQKSGKPNAAVCYFLEVYGIRKNFRVFLQHGIIMNDLPYVHFENSKYSVFCTSVKKEYDFVCDKFNYKNGEVVLTGLTRYDRLYDELCKEKKPHKKKILIMPTWRIWITPPSNKKSDVNGSDAFKSTQYYKAWDGIIKDACLCDALENADAELVFYMHRNMGKFGDSFTSENGRIHILDEWTANVQDLLMECDYLLTDYSSVNVDFAYLEKPLCYYQFDSEHFFDGGHLGKGYFEYENDGFGPVVKTGGEAVGELVKFLEGKAEDPVYEKRRNSFFTLKDNRNCERTYDAVKEKLLKR